MFRIYIIARGGYNYLINLANFNIATIIPKKQYIMNNADINVNTVLRSKTLENREEISANIAGITIYIAIVTASDFPSVVLRLRGKYLNIFFILSHSVFILETYFVVLTV